MKRKENWESNRVEKEGVRNKWEGGVKIDISNKM
jgi:hypothetical protein